MQQGGSQYGVTPDMGSYASTGVGSRAHMLDQLQQMVQPGDAAAAAAVLAEAASPISSRPPAQANFDELGPGGSGYPDEDALAGEEGERGGTSGNRWPRQETIALLKIRSEMDSAFKDATLKGPLWEDVSRKLAELGYNRSSKKCKEKFENVHKYYKRTKEARAGRQDGRNYRFFSQLEALNSNSTSITATMSTVVTPAIPISIGIVGRNPMIGGLQSSPFIPVPTAATPHRPHLAPPVGVSGGAAPAAGLSLSSHTSSSSGSEEDEIEEGEGLNTDARKRKREELGGGSNKKMMDFFERLIKEVMEKQEAMLQKFLETIEKREHDRMKREDDWRRQEMARLAREKEMLAQEKAMAASRDANVIAFLQRITGQTVQIAVPVTIPAAPPPQTAPAPPQPPQPQQPPQQLQQQQHHQQQHQPQQERVQNTEIGQYQQPSTEIVAIQQEQQEGTGGSFESTSSRWPKTEVLALIKIRSGLESRYQEAGPKGPLWEEISAGMRRMGYNRSAKRCKEKWENINKYYKKVKESNKKRPEDAKTCPYFHELDALYRKKLFGSGGGGGSTADQSKQQDMSLDSTTNQRGSSDVPAFLPPSQSQATAENKDNSSSSGSNKNGRNSDMGCSFQVQTSNGGLQPSFYEEVTVKKPEDIVKELMDNHSHHHHQKHHHHKEAATDEYDELDDSDNLDEDDEEEEEDDDNDDEDANEEDGKMAYKIQYQSPNPGTPNGQGNPTGSFLAIRLKNMSCRELQKDCLRGIFLAPHEIRVESCFPFYHIITIFHRSKILNRNDQTQRNLLQWQPCVSIFSPKGDLFTSSCNCMHFPFFHLFPVNATQVKIPQYGRKFWRICS